MTAVELITSVERRRRWGREEKLRIVAETARPGATVSQVARAHGVAPGQLVTWRRQLLAAVIGDCETESDFVPVRITPDPVANPTARPLLSRDNLDENGGGNQSLRRRPVAKV